MRSISENTVIQIEITNDCWLSCANCTRHVGHHAEPFYMSLSDIEWAIFCTLDSPCRIGLMGGEPTKHPDFVEICELYQRLVPYERREFWTSGFLWGEHKDVIKATFAPDRIHYNDHAHYGGQHQPLLVALDDVVDDPDLKAQLIDACPFQSHWSASITPSGAYFCEIAASLDRLLNNGANAWPVEPGWWKRGVADYGDQIDALCGSCSGALPLPKFSDARGGRDKEANRDLISPSNLEKLRTLNSPKVAAGQYTVFHGKLTREDVEDAKETWQPRQFRDFVAHDPQQSKAARERLRA